MIKNRKLMMMLATGLILCLMISVGLTSCGGNKDNAGESTKVEETETEPEENEEETEEDLEVDAPKVDESELLTEDEALEAALKDAGVEKNTVDSSIVELDADDEPSYGVQFISGTKEYDYTIDAKTGEVWDKDVYED